MVYFWIAVICIAGAGIAWYMMSRKTEPVAPESKGAILGDSGAILSISDRATYITKPGGERRKIADYAMDLTPSSHDMQAIAAAVNEAAKMADAQRKADRYQAAKEAAK